MLRFHVVISGALNEQRGLSVTFEHVRAELELLERLFIEPDGSFVWAGVDAAGGRWQVDGNLIDRGEALDHVELKGHCPEAQFDLLLRSLGWPGARLQFQLPRQGVFLEEAEFRQLAASENGAV
jgi:hypothetical protein